jgi:hypothetical protein
MLIRIANEPAWYGAPLEDMKELKSMIDRHPAIQQAMAKSGNQY